MKKFLAILLTLLLIFSLAACDKELDHDAATPKNKHNAMIKKAVEEMKDYCEDLYDAYEDDLETDRYFEIKNTRVITFKENDIEELNIKDIAYIVEFDVYSDYLGAAPYYTNTFTDSNVVVFKNGDMEVQRNVILGYRNKTYSNDFSGFIKSVDDYHDQYNWSGNLE